eukprot:gene10875-biopygen2193
MFSCVLVVLTLLTLISKHVHGQYTVTVFAGTGTKGNSGNNVPATSADISQVGGTWVDSNGVTFFADYLSSVIRRVGTDGIITTIGGTGTASNSNSGGAFTSVVLYNPWGLIGDSTFLYISDRYHIWKYQRSSGIVSILAGTGSLGTGGDGGPATSAQVSQPRGLWLNSDNSLYFVDYDNNLLRKINLGTNIISTVAGGGGSGNTGDGGPALSTNTRLNSPYGVYIDTNGVIFIAAIGTIRYIVNGISNTYAGGGPSSNTADGFVGTNAYFSTLFDVKGDTMGNIFVSGSSKVRVVDYSTKAVTTYVSGLSGSVTGIWLDYVNSRSVIGMSNYVKTAPLYVSSFVTTSPTAAPIGLQSKTPTVTPTFVPTVAPTFIRSEFPTANPTALPSMFPTETPSASTTPTTVQSHVPTVSPTPAPTIPRQPSSRPSDQPTLSPTISTFRPTRSPSFFPTVNDQVPSETPTHSPNSHLTRVPSLVPSANPTFSPSAVPSSGPSSRPSGQPTLSPTAPTFTPTRMPSLSPTVKNNDVVKVSGTSRVKFVNGQTLNKVSLATLVSAFHNISENAQSTEVTSTLLVVQPSPQSVRRGVVSGQAIPPNQLSYTYDIGFLSTYVMTYHAG